MNKQEYEKELTELKERIAFLEQNKPEEDSDTWKPEKGENFYKINGFGSITCLPWHNDNRDNLSLSIGNVFNTKEEAEFEIERLKVIQELKQFASDFTYKKENYYFFYDYDSDIIEIAYSRKLRGNDIYFATGKQAQEAIDTVGKERIKKYYFGVKDND